MMSCKRALLGVVALLSALLCPAFGQNVRHEIAFPNLPGYVTLKCDFHMHTVFSDGEVWPTVRVDETWRQGLDAIAITDHIEYQPHKDDVPTKHNRPYELATEPAAVRSLLLIHGAEITRETPPGHFNAIFTTDNKPLDTEDFLEAVKRANAQGAFVFWNHQGWKGAEKGRWLDVHTTLYQNKWLRGMEVCNDDTYYPEAHKWCLEKKLTMLGDTDIHEPDLRLKSTGNDHRTMTLVFAKVRTLPAIREALLEGRTAVWFKQQIIGRREFLEPLFKECVEVLPAPVWQKKEVWVQIRNNCDTDIQLQRTGGAGPEKLTLPARAIVLVNVARGIAAEALQLEYTATSFLIAPGTALPVVLTVPKA
jgi:3',5'-nucleoside bisphosphate phosphatase